jgi:hypothetical protein
MSLSSNSKHATLDFPNLHIIPILEIAIADPPLGVHAMDSRFQGQ